MSDNNKCRRGGAGVVVRADWAEAAGPQEFWAQGWNRMMVRAVARAFVAAVGMEPSLRLALGRLLPTQHTECGGGAGEGCDEDSADEKRRWEEGEWRWGEREEGEWRWGEKGICHGPLRDEILRALRGNGSVIVVEGSGGRHTCGIEDVMIRPADVSESMLSDAEAWQVLGFKVLGFKVLGFRVLGF